MARMTPKQRRLMVLRRASTLAQKKHSLGGRERTQHKPKPITLPRISFLEDKVER